MKRGLVAAGAVALLLLTGCTSEPQESAALSDETAGTVAPTPTPPAATPSATAGPVEVTAAPEQETAPQRDADDFLVRTQLALDNWGVTMNANQVRSAADYACDQLNAGTPHSDIVAITGDVPDYANGRFVDVVSQGYCPVR